MEQDIKILEGMLGFISVLNTEQRQALENLIKGYRELEKRIIFLTNLSCIDDSDENFIPKSKIKEKIEELENSPYWADCGDSYEKDIELLKSLLES